MSVLTYSEKWFKDKDQHFKKLQHVALDPSGNWVAFGCKTGLLLATADNGDLKAVVRNRYAEITSLLWPLSREAICGYSDGTVANISIWKNMIHITGIIGRGQSIEVMAVDKQCSNLAGGKADDIRVWRKGQDGSWEWRTRLGAPQKRQDNKYSDIVITGLHWGDSNAKHLIASYKYHGVQIWNVQTGEVERTLLYTSTPIGRTMLSPDYRYLAIGTGSGLNVYQVSNSHRIAALTTPASPDGPILFVHKGNAILAAGADGEVFLWSIPGGRRMQSKQHPDSEPVVALSDYASPSVGVFQFATVSKSHACLWEAVASDTTIANNIYKVPTRSMLPGRLLCLTLSAVMIPAFTMLWVKFGSDPKWM